MARYGMITILLVNFKTNETKALVVSLLGRMPFIKESGRIVGTP